MNIKKYHFNNKSIQNNEQLFNTLENSKNPKKNLRYSDKNFYQYSLPNQTFNFKPNILLQSEQSTLFSSEDLHNKNNNNFVQQMIQRNNCHCMCHQSEEEMKYNDNNEYNIYSQSINIPNHMHCCHHMNNHSYCRPIHRSVENNRNNNFRKTKNFELLYNYEKMKKQYNIIWPGCHQNRNERLNKFNCTTTTNNKISHSRNFDNLDNLDNKIHLRYINRSCDDMKNNNNYNDNFLLRKTKKILGFTFNDIGFLTNKNRHYKPNSVNYRTNNIKDWLLNRNNYLNNYGINTEIESPKRKPKNYIKNNNNHLIKEIIYQNNIPYINENAKDQSDSININNNNLMRSNTKPNNINYNNDLDENIINNISFGNNQKNDKYNRNLDINYDKKNNNFNKTFDKINKNSKNNIKNSNSNNKKNNINNNINIDINRDIKDIL